MVNISQQYLDATINKLVNIIAGHAADAANLSGQLSDANAMIAQLNAKIAELEAKLPKDAQPSGS